MTVILRHPACLYYSQHKQNQIFPGFWGFFLGTHLVCWMCHFALFQIMFILWFVSLRFSLWKCSYSLTFTVLIISLKFYFFFLGFRYSWKITKPSKRAKQNVPSLEDKLKVIRRIDDFELIILHVEPKLTKQECKDEIFMHRITLIMFYCCILILRVFFYSNPLIRATREIRPFFWPPKVALFEGFYCIKQFKVIRISNVLYNNFSREVLLPDFCFWENIIML